jgi:hypothetical protein
MTPPIGHNAQGQVIEEVVTTASRLPSEIPVSTILAGVALALLAWQLFDERPRRRARRRRR